MTTMIAGCYLSHGRGEDAPEGDASMVPDAGPSIDALPDAGPERCAPVPGCSGADAPRPLLWYPFDGDVANHGTASGGNGVGGAAFGSGVRGRGLVLGPHAQVTFAGTAELLAAAEELTLSIWVRATVPYARNFLDCRSSSRGFESYGTDGLTTCAGHGAGFPVAWGACATVLACPVGWTHFVLRWGGPGEAPEVASDGSTFITLVATDRAGVEHPVPRGFDLFDGTTNLLIGDGAGSLGTGEGTLEVDELRVYDVALSDSMVWQITECPVE